MSKSAGADDLLRKRQPHRAKQETKTQQSVANISAASLPPRLRQPDMGSDPYSKTSKSSSDDPIPKSLHEDSSSSLLTKTLPGIEQVPSDPSRNAGGNFKVTLKRHRPTSWFRYNKEGPPISYTVDVNVLWWVVMMISFITRFWKIDFPNFVIFDEVHFGKFSSYYLQQSFFFDVHPPLGKMIFAAVGYISGFDGSFLFSNIGVEYPRTVPYIMMRSLSALSGTLLVPCVYEIMLELGFSHRTALLASFFTIFDNSLVIQSRVIMLDSFLIFFTYLSILCFLKFYHKRHKPFSHSWHRGLIYTGCALGLLLGVKYTGVLGLACVGLLTICDLWQLVGDHVLNLGDLFIHTLLRAFYLLGIPVAMNFVLFYLHFAILTQAGPGAAFVSHAFQNSLHGTVDSPAFTLSPNATLLRYGSQFSLRQSDLSCWLHSHDHTYPLKYPDGRGSSYQQQVTCYEFHDPNNLWALRRPGDPNNSSVPVDDDSPVRNKDIVELVHISTDRLLNSHDVAAPLTPAFQEVAGYINYSVQFVPHLKWQLDVTGLKPEDPVYWEPGRLKMKIVHAESKQVLSSTGKRLPEWGFQQYEVVTDRTNEGALQAIWVIDELTVPKPHPSKNESRAKEEKEIKEKFLQDRQPRSLNNTHRHTHIQLSFWDKYFEMQYQMATAHSTMGDHTFAAAPANWPLMGKSLPYWLDENSNAQINLLGNPLLWWISTAAVIAFTALVTFYMMRRRRQVYDLSNDEFVHLWTSGSVLLIGWATHYLPYFLLSRVLFLHHYLPALPFKFMLLAAVCEHAYLWAKKLWPRVLLPIWYLCVSLLSLTVFVSFAIFAPFSYGYPSLTFDQILWRRWVETWDLLYRT